MKKFKDLILEEETAQKETKLNHLPHLHRLANVFPKGEDTDEEKSYGGHRGVETSDDFLNKLHDFMRGKKRSLINFFTESKISNISHSLIRKSVKSVVKKSRFTLPLPKNPSLITAH